MAKMGYAQDMAPPGGYGPIDIERKLPKKGNVFLKLGIFAGITAFGIVTYGINKKRWRKRKIEMNDARYAVMPIILAEQHRLTMRHWRKNRDEENELMKNVPGWETGTLYGEPVYYNPRGRFIEPTELEYYAHNSDQVLLEDTKLKRTYGISHRLLTGDAKM